MELGKEVKYFHHMSARRVDRRVGGEDGQGV